MKHVCKWTLAVAGLMLLPVAAQAQEKYTLNLKKPGKGATTHVHKTESEAGTVKVTDDQGMVLDNKNTNTIKTMTFVETVLERADPKKKATAVKRVYEKATVKTDADTKVLPFQGKTVIIEKKAGKYSFRYDGGAEITGDDAKYLKDEFNDDAGDVDIEALLLPGKAVALNEVWKISMPEFLKAFEKETKMSVHPDKAVGTGKLVKVYMKDGHQHGDFVISLELAVKSIKGDAGDMPCKPGTVAVAELKASGCIDGSTTEGRAAWNMRFDGTATAPADNPMFRIEFAVRVTSEETTKEHSKK